MNTAERKEGDRDERIKEKKNKIEGSRYERSNSPLKFTCLSFLHYFVSVIERKYCLMYDF
jgi:hypothetical protein